VESLVKPFQRFLRDGVRAAVAHVPPGKEGLVNGFLFRLLKAAVSQEFAIKSYHLPHHQ